MESTKSARLRRKSTVSLSTPDLEKENADSGGTVAPNLNGDNTESTISTKSVEEAKDADKEQQNKDKLKETPDEPPVLTKETQDDLEVAEKTKVSINDTENQIVEKNTRGKKRKASELKSEDENANEEVESEQVEPEKEPEPEQSAMESESSPEHKSQESEVTKATESEMDNMPPVQTMGKGKRARIPNKRYSDILLSANNRRKSTDPQTDLEIKQELLDSSLETSVKEEVVSPFKTTRNSSGSPSLPYKKQKTSSIDLTDPKFFKPFKFGWKRELVWRATNDSTTKRNGDIYYYTPTGKKVRSMREVSENLRNNKDLTLDNFTFFKESLGIDDPEKEIIRDAKVKSGANVSLVKKTLTKVAAAKDKKVSSPKVSSPKVSSPKVSSPKVSSPKVSSPKVSSLKTTANETADSSPSPVKTKGSPRNVGSFKVKPPVRKAALKKDIKSEEEMEVDSPPPAKSTPIKTKAGRWSKSTANSTSKPQQPKKRNLKLSSITNSLNPEDKKDVRFMESYLQNLSYGYNTLLYVFQYLKVQDLLRAGCVCTMWRDIASHPILWRTVRMKNSQVHSFEGLANTLKKHGTVHLDLRKMLLPSGGGEEIWPEFSKAIEKVQTLRKIELCRCPASVVEQLAVTNPNLEVINAVTIKCDSMNLDSLKSLTNIKELRIKSTSGLNITSIDSLKELKSLKHLSLTSISSLNNLNLDVFAELTNLESLDLGEAVDFPKNFGEDVLSKLEKLEKLRLEKGQGNCHTFEILEAVKNMPNLEQLELVNFDIKAGFDKALGACQNIKKLLIIPTYISQSATTNHMVLGGVLRLQKTLSHFVWGVTLELLRVTELFVDQCEDPKEKKEKKPTGNGDSIPVLKPVPILKDNTNYIPPAHEPPQVEILPLPNLQKLLLNSLPTTRVKILKIPFHATWRQSLTDSV